MALSETQLAELTSRIVVLLKQKHYQQAEALAASHLSPEDDSVRGLQIFSSIYRATKRTAASEVCCKRALLLNPDDAATHTNYGNLLTDLNRLDEAVFHTGRAYALEPHNETILRNHICTLRESKRFAEAEPFCDQLIALTKGTESAHYLSSQIYLYQNKYAEGWQRYEYRFHQEQYAGLKKLEVPRWQGTEDTVGKSLLIVGEQGFGDMMLVTRFFPELARRFARVSLLCKPALHRLFADLPVTLLTEGQPVPDLASYDYYVSSMSVPARVAQDWTQWPGAVPLIAAPQSPVIVPMNKKLKVGIVWSGSVTFGGNAKRAVGLERFLQLMAAVPEVQFYSFQKGPCEADLVSVGSYPLIPVGHKLGDFAETAAAIQQMDCLVMTDTSLVHLCGIFNVPVFALLNYLPYWLYYPEARTTPLYHSVRFIRQQQAGAWDEVFAKAAKMLSALAQTKAETQNYNADTLLAAADAVLGG